MAKIFHGFVLRAGSDVDLMGKDAYTVNERLEKGEEDIMKERKKLCKENKILKYRAEEIGTSLAHNWLKLDL